MLISRNKIKWKCDRKCKAYRLTKLHESFVFSFQNQNYNLISLSSDNDERILNETSNWKKISIPHCRFEAKRQHLWFSTFLENIFGLSIKTHDWIRLMFNTKFISIQNNNKTTAIIRRALLFEKYFSSCQFSGSWNVKWN